jgi:putative NIF3 family GTP cyclohydrolase 1 type 2
VQYGAPAEKSSIKTVALCAGSGGSMFKNVKADLYWTGEMSHVSTAVLEHNDRIAFGAHHEPVCATSFRSDWVMASE